MRRNSPSPRPAAFPPPSPPPMSLGIVRGFIGTMQPSDSSPVCMPIVRLLPSWAGPECWPDTDEISQVPTKGRHHVHMGSATARGSSSASHLRGEDVAFRPTVRRQHLEIRPVSLLDTQPVISPVNASSWPSRAALASGQHPQDRALIDAPRAAPRWPTTRRLPWRLLLRAIRRLKWPAPRSVHAST